jgi:hypothetical protein
MNGSEHLILLHRIAAGGLGSISVRYHDIVATLGSREVVLHLSVELFLGLLLRSLTSTATTTTTSSTVAASASTLTASGRGSPSSSGGLGLVGLLRLTAEEISFR